ncbi:MAG: putative phosphoserine phosphatase 2 [Candidatus Heimdallarchaeota archaeon LC_2]|nr:MAG: putative phosphoserine phosphatase 2 [Candidatus Heimdallarchaeota archaeon LC_2]
MRNNRRIYLLRHGIPSNEYKGSYDILPGPELSEFGRKQAIEAAKWFNSKKIDLIYSSPFTRAYQTSKPICKLLNIRHKIVDPLQEQNNQETYSALKYRVINWWNSESMHLADKTPIIISHGAPLNAFISNFDNNLTNYRTFGRGNLIPMGGIWELNQDSNKKIASKLVWLPPFLNDLGKPKFKNIKLNLDRGTEI